MDNNRGAIVRDGGDARGYEDMIDYGIYMVVLNNS